MHCEGGYRSAIAASVLANAGRPDVLDMVGGFKAWAASKLPVQVETDASAQEPNCNSVTAKGGFHVAAHLTTSEPWWGSPSV